MREREAQLFLLLLPRARSLARSPSCALLPASPLTLASEHNRALAASPPPPAPMAPSLLLPLLFFFFFFSSSSSRIVTAKPVSHKSPASISSDSVLVALLDSPYTELAEMADEATLLQQLEEVVGKQSITILAPKNAFLENNLDPDFKKFLLEPGNIDSLQRLLRFHVISDRILAADWGNRTRQTLSSDGVEFSSLGGKLKADLSTVIAPDAIVRRDGIVHGIDRLLIPKAVQDAYSVWKEGKVLVRALAVLPEGAPTLEARKSIKHSPKTPQPPSPPVSIFYAMAPGPSLAPAPAPGPSTGRRWFDGESEVADFISTLVHYGGYNEMADLLVNLTSLAPELAKLVSEGYRITVLAPNDEAMSKLTAEHLTAPGAPEQIIYYHILPEYQTEESFYNSVRRFGKVTYETLRVPHRVTAQEADGTVIFGEGEDAAHLYDHDIYIDGRISVQGIDKVLTPPDEKKAKSGETTERQGRALSEEEGLVPTLPILKRGWFGGAFCSVLGAFASACQ